MIMALMLTSISLEFLRATTTILLHASNSVAQDTTYITISKINETSKPTVFEVELLRPS